MKENQTHLRKKQQEILTEIGEYLHEIRCQQGLSLEDVAIRSCIRATLLGAIEQGNLNALPEPVYVRGFIKRFADHLGLDGEEIARKFPQSKLLDIYPSAWWKFPLVQLRPVHLYIVYIAMVIGAVSGLSHLVQRSALQQVTQIETPSPVQPLPNPNPSVEVSLPINQASNSGNSTLISSQSDPNSNKPVVVGIYLQEESWLKVSVDGKTEFEGILPKGEKRNWKANEEITVRAGNAGAVLVAFNNEEKRLGARGQVMQATYSSKLDQ